MNLRDFLGHEAIQLPLKRDTEDFQKFAESTLDRYLEVLQQIEQPVSITEEVRKHASEVSAFCGVLKNVVRLGLEGKPFDAYRQFREGVNSQIPLLDELAATLDKPADLGILYRVRTQIVPSLSREGLFHVPFECRHKVATQRYSIPGLPCLYLGGSLYTCWCEMGRPPFHELQVAAFWLKGGKQVKLVNFSNRPKRLLCYITPDGGLPPERNIDELLLTHVLLWPLMAMCSIAAKHVEGAFKPEYILPQILLQWINETGKYDGVCYFSTHIVPIVNYPIPPCNFVFPAREIKAEGRCSYLRGLFKMTEPVSWQLLRAIRIGPPFTSFVPQFELEFVDGLTERYGPTEFGAVETKLNELVAHIKLQIRNGEESAGDVAE